MIQTCVTSKNAVATRNPFFCTPIIQCFFYLRQANLKKTLSVSCESPIPLDIRLKLAKVFENDTIHFEDNLVFNKIY